MKKKFFVGLLIAIVFMLPLFFGNIDGYAYAEDITSETVLDFEGNRLDTSKLNASIKDKIGGDIVGEQVVDGGFVVLKNFVFDIDTENSSGLFNSANSAKICNIVIDSAEFIINFDSTNTTNFGILVGTAKDTEISNIKIINSSIKFEGSKKLNQINIGGLVGNANNCSIKNVEITNLKLNDDVNAINVNTSLNYGTCVGIASGNSEIKNAIFDCKIDVNIISSFEEQINIGGIIGFTDTVKIYNTINKLSADVASTNNNVKVCIGGLVGISQGENIDYVNNALLLFEVNSECKNKLVGSLVGKLDKNMMPNFGKIRYFKTTATSDIFGNYSEITYNTDTSRIIKDISPDSFTKSSFYSDAEWDPSNYWDFDNAWDFIDASSIPSLQAFNTFNFVFSESDSLGTLGLNKMPTYIVGNETKKIIKANFNGNDSKDSININYDSEFYFIPQIETENSYNKFFYITGVRQNGQSVFMISDYLDFIIDDNLVSEEGNKTTYTLGTKTVIKETITGTSHGLVNPTKYTSNFNDFVYEVDETGKMCFSILNINKSNEGTYSVVLEKYKYQLEITALKSTNEEEAGKVMLSKEINTDKAKEEIVQEVEYGLTYSYTAVPNEDYADIVNWKMRTGITETSSGTYKKFGNNESEIYKASNVLEFTFDENSEFEFKNLLTELPNKTGTNDLGISIDLEFTNNIRIVRFEFIINGENSDEDLYQNAKLYISGTLLEAKDGELTRKLIIGSEYVLSVSIPQDYSFNQWQIEGSTQPYQTSDYCKINISDGTGELTISIILNKAEENTDINLTWLYITLGGLGGVGLIVLIVFAIRKRKKDDSYKKMYY